MKYSVKHPNPAPMQEVEPGLMFSGSLDKCWHCNAPCAWIDLNFEAYFCSEECRQAKWEEYLQKTALIRAFPGPKEYKWNKVKPK